VYLAWSNWTWQQTESPPGADVTTLEHRVAEEPADREAWLLLGSAYTRSGQLPLAIHAFDRASTLAGGNDPVALAGLGEAMLLSGEEARVATANALFERSLALDPQSPKALFYSGLLAMNAGNPEMARTRFSALLAQDPPEQVRSALANQIAAIDQMLHPPVDRATLIDLRIEVAPALHARLPAGGALFVFVRNPDGAAPLATKRLSVVLPVQVQLSAADSMLGSTAIRAGQTVQVVARVSASGQPAASSGDLYGEISYRVGEEGERRLVLDHAVQ
jgi:cytochrome c-type biogenesis protein CcmH